MFYFCEFLHCFLKAENSQVTFAEEQIILYLHIDNLMHTLSGTIVKSIAVNRALPSLHCG